MFNNKNNLYGNPTKDFNNLAGPASSRIETPFTLIDAMRHSGGTPIPFEDTISQASNSSSKSKNGNKEKGN